ncbi:uncharacterized protein LOC111640630 [Centruroides sculpturatus]|uniref:uncharacterized protein LOC111640630 n=1 Tax=Centruroides sculpturatus TaxID=218467 RepID=UPI000C6ED2DC|nr:uncharacterized protein LOC111640630 [Centruroides sculpturatus]
MLGRERFLLYVLLIICYCSYTEQYPEHYLKDKRPMCYPEMEEVINHRKARIVGGFTAEDRFDQMRFVAEIHTPKKRLCLATVVTEKHLITAAHCLYGYVIITVLH